MLNSPGQSDPAGAAGSPPSQPRCDADAQAAHWWLRRREGLTADDAALLDKWLDADPAHPAALKAMEETAQALDALPDGAGASLAAIARASTHPAGKPPDPVVRWRNDSPDRQVASAPRRRRAAHMTQAALAGIFLVVAGTGGWMVRDHFHAKPVFAQTYATVSGQQMRARLPDGSDVELDVDTRLDVTLYRDRREVRLDGGQVHFSVRPDAAKPFRVAAANTLVTVVGTRFAVRHVGSQVRVAVDEGSVRVQQRDASGQTLADPSGAVLLKAGDVADAGPAGQPPSVSKTGVETIAAWRHGRVIFDNTPLADAIAEFGRYGHGGVVVRDADVAAMGITGNFNIGEFSGFISTLPQVLPVRLTRRGPEAEIVRR